jgi:hypothetical protein
VAIKKVLQDKRFKVNYRLWLRLVPVFITDDFVFFVLSRIASCRLCGAWNTATSSSWNTFSIPAEKRQVFVMIKAIVLVSSV